MTAMSQPPVLFVAGTGQHSGKTLVSLGLVMDACRGGLNVRYMKPVGQRTVRMGDEIVDEDVALVINVCKLPVRPSAASPVTIPPGFTRKFLTEGGDVSHLREEILSSFEEISYGADVVIVEGTGHAGVGSVFDLSNADVAHLLGAKAVIVTSGGIGRPIDEVMLNKGLFDLKGVELLGVILNKVRPDKLDTIATFVEEGLARHGIELLGVIPHEDILANPTMRQILDESGGDLLHGEAYLDNEIETVIVGAMTAHRALDYIYRNCLLITPGDRDDLILAAMSSCSVGMDKANCVAGMLLTGGVQPHENIMRLIRRTQIPVILVKADSYAAAAAVNSLKIKILPTDKKKIVMARRLVRRFVDVDRLAAKL